MAELDPIDLRIVEHLRLDGRQSVNALAKVVGVSRANAYRRLDRLQRDGVIQGFTARVDHEQLGRPIGALLLISVQQRRWRSVRSALAELDGVEYLAATTGEFDFLALIRIPDMTTLRDVVLGRLQSIAGVVGTRTVFVLDEVRRP